MNRRNILTGASALALAGCGSAGMSMVTQRSSAAPPAPPASPGISAATPGTQIAGASVPGNFFYPGDYTTTSPGMASAVQAAYDDAAKNGGTVVTDVPLLLNEPINCTSSTGGNTPGVTFLNLAPTLAPGSGFVLNHDSIGFDCTGNTAIQFVDTTITTPNSPSVVPKIGVLFAASRYTDTPVLRMVRPRMVGSFSIANIYNYGAEQFLVDAGYIYNASDALGAKCAVFTVNNLMAVASIVPGLIAAGVKSMTIVDLAYCNWLMMAGGASSDCVCVDGIAGLHSQGGWAINPTGRSIMYIDNSNSDSGTSDCSWENMRLDTDANKVQYGLLFGAASQAQIHTNWKVRNIHFATKVNAIASADAHTTLSGFSMQDNSEQYSLGLNIPGAVDGYSTLRVGPMPIKIGTLSNSYIEGASGSWSVGFGPGVNKVTYG